VWSDAWVYDECVIDSVIDCVIDSPCQQGIHKILKTSALQSFSIEKFGSELTFENFETGCGVMHGCVMGM